MSARAHWPPPTPELRAILAHEAHHRHRRDPLRLLLARAAAAALGPLPPFASLPERQPAIADLAADAATVAALGDRAPLAAALVRFEAVAPERVDGLLGTLRAPAISPAVLAVAGAVARRDRDAGGHDGPRRLASTPARAGRRGTARLPGRPARGVAPGLTN